MRSVIPSAGGKASALENVMSTPTQRRGNVTAVTIAGAARTAIALGDESAGSGEHEGSSGLAHQGKSSSRGGARSGSASGAAPLLDEAAAGSLSRTLLRLGSVHIALSAKAGVALMSAPNNALPSAPKKIRAVANRPIIARPKSTSPGRGGKSPTEARLGPVNASQWPLVPEVGAK